MHNLRLNLLFLLVLALVLYSMSSSFLGMILASSNYLISWSTISLYFKGNVYGFETICGPSVRISSSIKLVLPMSVADFDTVLVYLALSNSFSLFLVSCRISASGVDLVILGVSGSNCRLVVPGISGQI